MKVLAKKDLHTLIQMITYYYDDYSTIHKGYITDDVYFLVVEKFFFRTSNRASLSIVLTQTDIQETIITAIGSGGGQGMIFKFDWGAKESFEHAIPKILQTNSVEFTVESK